MRHEFHSYVGHCFIKPRSFKTSNDVSHGWCSSRHQNGFMSPQAYRLPLRLHPDDLKRGWKTVWAGSVVWTGNNDKQGRFIKDTLCIPHQVWMWREREKIKIHSLWPKKKIYTLRFQWSKWHHVNLRRPGAQKRLCMMYGLDKRKWMDGWLTKIERSLLDGLGWKQALIS